MRGTNYNISPCREKAAPRVIATLRLSRLCGPCVAQSIVGTTEAGPGDPAVAREPGQRAPRNPVTSAALGEVTGFSASCVPVSLEDILQDEKAGDLSFCSEMWGPLRVDVGVGVRCAVNVVFSGPFFVGLRSPPNCLAVQFGEQDSKLPGLALPAQQ